MDEKKNVVNKTIEYIEDNLDEDLKLDDIANHVNYSKFHLNRLFSETVGTTIHKYIQKRRLTVAAEKLVSSEDSIAEIAFEAKYESQQAFTLAFKGLYLCTPQTYRRMGSFIPRQDKFTINSKLMFMNSKLLNNKNIMGLKGRAV